MEIDVDVAIIGAGTAGLAALSRVRAAGKSFVLIDGGELGTTCARVGCMPSKAALQIAEDFNRRHRFERIGIGGTEDLDLAVPEALEHVRDLRDIFVDRVLSGSTDELGDRFVEGHARFVEPTVLEAAGRRIRARKVIIATGSRPSVPSAWEALGDRVLTTDNLFEQEDLPSSVAVIGLGAVGLEMGQALHRMGVRVTGVERLETVGGLQDPVASKAAVEIFAKEWPLWLGHEARIEEDGKGIVVSSAERSVTVERLLVCLGRTPNVDGLALDALGVALDERGVPRHDPHTLQIADHPVFIAGDVIGDRAILHEASHQGRIAGVNAASDEIRPFKRYPPLAIVFSDPNVATVGAAWSDLDEASIAVGEIRLGPVGRALIMGKNRGVVRIYADAAGERLLGASIVAPHGEHLAHLLAWCIAKGLTVPELLRMPYYHPVMEEAILAALQAMPRTTRLGDGVPPELEPLDE